MGLMAYLMCAFAALSLLICVLVMVLPNATLGRLYKAGADVDLIMLIFGVAALGFCSAAVLFGRGILRFISAAILALVVVIGIFVTVTLPRGLSPLPISDTEGLESINRFKFGSYMLTDDVALSRGVTIKRFSGKLDGNGHKVSGINGLSIINNHGSIEDLTIEGFSVSGARGALLCENNFGAITGVTVDRSAVNCTDGSFVLNNCGSVKECFINADYHCSRGCGGVVLENSGSIERCEFNGSFDCAGGVGGIAYSQKKGAISNCSIRGRVVNALSGSCGAACKKTGGRIEKCYADIMLSDRVADFYPICSSILPGDNGSVTRCYAAKDEAYAICGDCVLLSHNELSEAKLLGFDFENVWCFDEKGDLRLRASGVTPTEKEPVPESTAPADTEEPVPTETPAPVYTPEPTEAPTEEPALTPEQIYGLLDVYPTDEELAAGERTGRVTGGNINVRKGPSTNNDRIFTAVNGSSVTVLASHGGWYFIKYGDRYGWISKSKVTLD